MSLVPQSRIFYCASSEIVDSSLESWDGAYDQSCLYCLTNQATVAEQNITRTVVRRCN